MQYVEWDCVSSLSHSHIHIGVWESNSMFFVMKSINQSAELFTDSFYASHLMLLLTIFCPLNFLEHRIIHQRIISKWSYNVLFCCQASSMQYCDYCFTLTSNQSCPTLNCQSPLMHMSPLVTSFTIAQARNQKKIPTFLYLYTVPININISYLLYLHKCLSWVIFFHGATYHVCSWWPEASILSFFFQFNKPAWVHYHPYMIASFIALIEVSGLWPIK